MTYIFMLNVTGVALYTHQLWIGMDVIFMFSHVYLMFIEKRYEQVFM